MEDISEKGIIHNKYIIKDTLGKGGFGKVYLVNEINTDKEYALKLLKKKDEKIEKKIEFIKIISSNKSRYITNMIDNGEGPFIKNGENKGNKQYIVYEYEPKGDLYDYFIYPNQPFLEEEFAKIIFKNILKGVQIIHKNKICHRDIKLENILLDKNFCPKICDFGFLIKTVEGRNLKGRCGTKGYMAPEMLNNDKNYKGYNGLEADLGATLIKLVTGKELKELQEEYVKDIKNNKNNFESYFQKINNIIKDKSPNLRDLILRMMDFNPNKRPNIDQLLLHPWMTEVKDNDLDQEKKIYKEFEKREKIYNDYKSKNYTYNTNTTKSEDLNINTNRSSGDNDYEYFQTNFYLKYINNNNLNIKDYIKINGHLNPLKFMNLISNKIIKDNDKYYIKPSKKGYKFDIILEYDMEDEQEEIEEEIKESEEEYFDYENNGINKKDLIIQVILFKTFNGDYLIRFYKKSGDIDDYYEKIKRISSIIKEVL